MCDASRVRTRQVSGEALSYWPRRSARLIGIPAEFEEQNSKSEQQYNKTNGSVEVADDEHQDEESAVSEKNDAIVAEEDQCKDCKQRKTKQLTKQARTLEALLVESERFMHYPSRGGGCRMGRSTYNSRDIRPPPTSPCQQEPTPSSPLPVTVDQVQFSFEMVPSGTSWYQTFLRDEAQASEPLPDEPPTGVAPFLLPYEMSLEAILKSNRTVRKPSPGRPKGSKKSVPIGFRPIISTRLQMQSAAKQSQLAATSAKHSGFDKRNCSRHDRRQRQKPWFNMPRKSPRCHASTMAILCSKSDSESEAAVQVAPKVAKTVVEPQLPEEEEAKEEVSQADGDLVQMLEEMLNQGVEKRPPNNTVRKRGRPRKRPLPPVEQTNGETDESPLTNLLATPLERIRDIVDERILPTESCSFSDEQGLPLAYLSECFTVENPPEMTDVFHDLDSNSGSRSSSVYETASEIGSTSTSTGTCDSRRKAWRSSNRRKRRNMTGWPRSKRRRPPLTLNIIDVDDDLNLTGDLSCNGEDEDDDPPVLSPIREESTLVVDGSESRPQPQPRSSYVSKPFQFQRKTLRFVGKRILRPAAQRHAPQRLEYWPCFTTESNGKRRKRKTS